MQATSEHDGVLDRLRRALRKEREHGVRGVAAIFGATACWTIEWMLSTPTAASVVTFVFLPALLTKVSSASRSF